MASPKRNQSEDSTPWRKPDKLLVAVLAPVVIAVCGLIPYTAWKFTRPSFTDQVETGTLIGMRIDEVSSRYGAPDNPCVIPEYQATWNTGGWLDGEFGVAIKLDENRVVIDARRFEYRWHSDGTLNWRLSDPPTNQ